MDYKQIIAKLLGIHPDEIDRYVEGNTMIWITYHYQTFKYHKADLDEAILSTRKPSVQSVPKIR